MSCKCPECMSAIEATLADRRELARLRAERQDLQVEESMAETVGQIAPIAEHAARLTTTLNRLRVAGACADRYQHLLRALGGPSVDHDAPINLLTILEHNGVDDSLWALYAKAENCDTVARLMVADFAEAVLPIFERERPNDRRPRTAVETTRRFAHGQATREELAAAWAAARDAQAQIIRRYLLP